MANEISVTSILTCTKAAQTVTGLLVKLITLTGSNMFAGVQNLDVAGTPELIVYPAGLLAEGITYVWFKNLDATNYIEIALDNFTNIFTKLLAGQVTLLRCHTASPTHYARANTGACLLQIVAVGT